MTIHSSNLMIKALSGAPTSTMNSSQSRIESSQSKIESSQSTMHDGIGRNTKKMVESYITWLLYNQNPLRSNMAQPYRLIVWI